MTDILWQFDIVFSEARDRYNEGQELAGEVVIDLKEDMVIEVLSMEFSGVAFITWSPEQQREDSSSRGRTQHKTMEEKYLNQTLALYKRGGADGQGESKSLMVKSGKHTYPFQIQLPYNLPSSFVGDFGSVRYQAKAILERPWQPKITTVKEFTLRSVVDLNNLPQTAKPVTCEKVKKSSIFCCRSGRIAASWRLDKMGFIPGEKLCINGEITNESRIRIKRSKATLLQHIRYYDGGGNALHERKQVGQIEKGEVLPGHIGFWREEIEIPSLPPTGLKGCSLMDLWYTLKLKAIPAGLHDRMECVTDIVIATVPRGENAQTVFTGFTQMQSGTPSQPAGQPAAEETAVDLSYFI